MTIIEIIEGVLKEHGVDWILNERLVGIGGNAFEELMAEIKVAIKNWEA